MWKWLNYHYTFPKSLHLEEKLKGIYGNDKSLVTQLTIFGCSNIGKLLLIYSFNKHLLSAKYMPGTVLCAEDTLINKTGTIQPRRIYN